MYQDEPDYNNDDIGYTQPVDDMDDFDEVNNNDIYQDEIDTIVTSSTVYKKNRKSKTAKKVLEKGEYSTEQVIQGRKVKINYFNTGFTPGLTIRHAISGMYEKGDLVGSVSEDLYFKVKRSPPGVNERDPHFLYFYSPTEYENHFSVEVSKNIKDAWAQKVKNARKRQLAEEDSRSRRQAVVVK
jgi:hypothetical protein